MIDDPRPLTDRQLGTATSMSCRREPACFGFVCPDAASAPLPIDRLYFDIISADFHRGRASVWATLEMQPDAAFTTPHALLGFDETFLRRFTCAVLAASASRQPSRLTIPDADGSVPRLVEYVRAGGGTRLETLIIRPFEQVLAIAAPDPAGDTEATLFQLPRTDSFLRAFARMAHLADSALIEVLADMARLARRHQPPAA